MSKTTKKTSPRPLIDLDKLQKITSRASKNFSKKTHKSLPSIIAVMLSAAFFVVAMIFIGETLPHFRNIASVKVTQIWPSAFDPIARFAANMDWDTNTIKLDASMSKAFEDDIEQYIWRIDDGHSITGADKFEHTFQNPGYYLVQLSIVDKHGQSDVATCQLLIPPQEVEQIEISSSRGNYQNRDQSIENTNYVWAPKGTFYNYSKLQTNNKSYADIRSRYVESGCGLSNKGYNISDVTSNVSLRNSKIRRAVAGIGVNTIIGAIILAIYLIAIKKVRKIAKKRK